MNRLRAGLLASLLLLASPLSAQALLPNLPGRTLPVLAGKNLRDVPIALPRDFRGKPGVIVAAFSLGARADTTTWATRIAHAYASKGRVDAYVLAVVEAPAFVEPLVRAALRAGQPEHLYRWGMTVMDGDKRLRAAWGVGDDALAQVLLVAPGGKVRWATGDGYTPQRWLAFEQAIAPLIPRPKS